MSVVKGDGVILKFLRGDSYLPFGCARSITLNTIVDIAGKSTIGSGNWKEKKGIAVDWNFSIEGVVYLNKNGFFSANDIYQKQFNLEEISIEFFLTDTDGTTILMGGNAILSNVSANGTVNNVSSFNVTGEGTGALWSTTSFRITTVTDGPGSGQTTLTFEFEDVQGATGYTIHIRNITDDTESDDAGGASPRNIIVTSDDDYAFSLKPTPDGQFGPEIFWP